MQHDHIICQISKKYFLCYYLKDKIKKLKFVIFSPNVKEAENPFPGTPFPMFVYNINNWFPDVDVIIEGRVFPLKTFN